VADGIQIERSQHAQEFVIIGNAEARDNRLSFRARGLHHHLLSLPPGWRVTTTQLATDNPEGRDAIRSALNELIACGYVTKAKRQDERGRWSTVMTVHDKPQPKTDSQAPVTEDGFPGVGNPGVGKSGAIPKTVNEDVKEGPVDLASRHARAKKRASTQRDIPTVIREVRAAAEQVYGQGEAAWISDGDLLGLYFSKKGSIRPGNLVAYMAKIMSDAPSIDSLLSNSEAVCTACVQWDSDCKCPAA
jgi:hypothetical protein